VPNYTRYVERGRRAEARELMMRVASAEERYYTNFNRYTADITNAAPTGLGLPNLRSEHYTVAVVLGPTNQQ
jgi:type IV pilus assembly protein PilE